MSAHSIILLPGYLEKIGLYCFRGCTGLERINIPDDVAVIGEYAFKGCSELKEINITPFSKLASLGDYAFATGTRLKPLYLPIGLTHISELAFKSCHVESLYLDWETPPVLKAVPKGGRPYPSLPEADKHMNQLPVGMISRTSLNMIYKWKVFLPPPSPFFSIPLFIGFSGETSFCPLILKRFTLLLKFCKFGELSGVTTDFSAIYLQV